MITSDLGGVKRKAAMEAEKLLSDFQQNFSELKTKMIMHLKELEDAEL